MFLVSETLMMKLILISIVNLTNSPINSLLREKSDLILFETEDIDGDGIISPNEIATNQVMTEEAALQIYDYFPRVSTESRVDIEVETTTKFENAQIDGFVIENSGVSYQVNDTLFFDNTGTDGFGASAQVESVQGAGIAQYRKEVINDIPYGRITTTQDHELIAQDEVIVSSRVITENTNKRFYMSVVTGIDSISITQSGIGYNEAIPPTYEIILLRVRTLNLILILMLPLVRSMLLTLSTLVLTTILRILLKSEYLILRDSRRLITGPPFIGNCPRW